jgi:hypothetical protein
MQLLLERLVMCKKKFLKKTSLLYVLGKKNMHAR